MSVSTLSARLKDLEKEKLIRRVIDNSKRPVGTSYILTDSCSPIEEVVVRTVEELRRELQYLREPTVKEVASKVGELPENARSSLYALAPKLGWRGAD
jgi:DNA-binding HxlR family transcriptional regulator